MVQCLKRSLSSSTLNHVVRRKSISGMNTLHRTYSQSSVYSTPMNISQNLNNESFQEFYSYLNGDEYYKKVGLLWENLPQETRDIFIARVMSKKCVQSKGRNSIDCLDGLKYDVASELFDGCKTPTKNSYLHFQGKLAPHFYGVGQGKYDAATVSRIIGRIYNQELSLDDKRRLKDETMEIYRNVVRERLYGAKQYIEINNIKSKNDPYLSTVDTWSEKKIGQRVEEINSLIRRIEAKQETLTEKKKKKKKSIVNSIGRHSKKLVKILSKKNIDS
ncbi:similar to Naumovozyma dairenensis NDAI_0C01930 hypothetical protein [Maudiozyma saulgeensis]|uniref:Uncharacterized protein n=1 Tax=Maudiozyma saulgeensis TaxID=1789683 RepID=A0A1X7R2K3_9SACH|nr:similar to Naumovozyma dairenensis NDAI_0C01930 hypothetical protein [Kazachstania saulgeensis]